MSQAPFYLTLWVSALLATQGLCMLVKPSGCGSSMGCFANCHTSDTNCKSVVTWKSQPDGVDFELHLDTTGTGGNVWVSVGLSDDKTMGLDSVTDCIKNGADIEILKSYNEASKTNSRVILPNGASYGLSNEDTSYTGGVLTCKYRQSLTHEDDKIFDLTTDWHLLVAYGEASGSKFRHQVAGEDAPKISSDKVDLQSNEDVGEAVQVLVKVHGVLMIFGWMFCASIGIVLARFFKPMFPNTKVCKEKVWFAYHRLCMITCLLAVVAGFIIIFVDVGGWAKLDGHTKWQKAHPYIGVIVTFFAVLNPIMALLRPHPDDKNRYLFNWLHWFVGTAAHILSVMAIVLGLTLGKSSVPFDVVWVVVGWAAYQAVFVLLMEIHECTLIDRASKYRKDGAPANPPGSWIKVGMLCLHLLVITALTVVCIVIVAIN